MSELRALAESIRKSGILHVFGIPGSGTSLELLDALEAQGVQFHLTHFEGTGTLMAGAGARLSGRAGVSISIKGPGLANMVPGLAACRLEGWPVVSISEAYLPGTPPFKAHKRMDHGGLLSAVTKGKRFLSRKGPQFPELAKWAEAEVPGPVHLEIAGSVIEDDAPIPVSGSSDKDASTFQQILDLINSADRPVLIAGTWAIRCGLSSSLKGLTIPVFSVAAAKGVVDETLPHAAGVYTGVGLEMTPEFRILPRADLVIGLGLRHNEVLDVKPFHCKSVNIDPTGPTQYSGFHFGHTFRGGLAEANGVCSALSGKGWGAGELENCFKDLWDEKLSGPFMPAKAFHIIEKHFENHCRLVLDTGNFCTIGEHFWQVLKPESYLAAGQGRYMGVGLPLALGAAIYDSDIPTVLFSGDGGIGMFISDVKIAVKERLPLIIVLMTDAYLGSIRIRSIKDGLTERPVTIHQPSWLKVFEAFDMDAGIAGNEGELEEILKYWSPSDGPLFIEIPFDPEDYQQMVKGIR